MTDTRTVLVTGSAGFIGFHLCRQLLEAGHHVLGVDNLSPYYDVDLKKRRHAILQSNNRFQAHIRAIEDEGFLTDLFAETKPELVCHLAAQAGVRYSLEAPRSYVASNVNGVLELLEAARAHPPKHLLMASTSSAYGAETDMPYREDMASNLPMSFYAATKKANEAMAHSYAHLYGLPITLFRFFTVYGPWGRPDMALFKFVDAIREGRAIDIYNHGNMKRDFTYVDDLVEGILRLSDIVPQIGLRAMENDSISPVAPWRVVNIGNGAPVPLEDFVTAIETALGEPARRNYLEMQPGDVPATWADTSLFEALAGPLPRTDLQVGINRFVDWFDSYRSAR